MAGPAPEQGTVQGPLLGKRVLESLLIQRLPARPEYRLVLVHGRYAPDEPAEFPVRFTVHDAEERRHVTVVEQDSVLAMADAWYRHRDSAGGGTDTLVIVTTVPDSSLGWDLRGHALKNQVLDVDRVDMVRHRFGAAQLDPRLAAAPWLASALLDAEPREGWPRTGGLLTWDHAMHALTVARLGLGGPPGPTDTPPDADALLAWSGTPTGPDRFARLPAEEQRQITNWLADVAGPAARPLLDLAADGRGRDAMPLGMVGSVLDAPTGPAATQAGMALGALFGRQPDLAGLRALTQAVRGTLARWLADTGNGGRPPGPRERALDVLRRADTLAAETGLTDALVDDPYLPSGFEARLGALAAALPESPEEAERALARLREHRLAPVHPHRVDTAESAVRLVRRLALPAPGPRSVAEGTGHHLADWGWMDAALAVLWAGDPAASGVVAAAYGTVCERVQERRAALDAEFAERLAGWARTAVQLAPGGALLVEDVLAEVVAPLRGKGSSPLVVVLDGMSSADAVGLAVELAERGTWVEAGRRDGARDTAVATIPSLTRTSRASLLTGALTEGGQGVERDGFAAFWAHRRDPGATLFHKADIPGSAGRRLSNDLHSSLAGPSAVGVVLNTIDESLDHSPQGDRTGWRIADITYLEELLDAARSYGRPVVLVADHGHVLDRGETAPTPMADGDEGAARWRTGTPGAGEVALTGPRVLDGKGTIVAAWREGIRYTPRKGGYHGGASLAEMTVPVLVFLPSAGLLPKGWSVLAPEMVTPAWWRSTPSAGTPGAEAARAEPAVRPRIPTPAHGTPAPRAARDQPAATPSAAGDPNGAAGPAAEPAAQAEPATLGRRIVASEVYAAQRHYVKRGPKPDQVAAAIDALAAADGTLSVAALAEAAGFSPTRASGLTAMVQRLLNVEGYPVLEAIDGGTRLRLNVPLARQQFGVRGAAEGDGAEQV